MNEREERRTKRLLSNAKFKDTTANLADIEYSSSRGMDRSVILSLANNEFVKKSQNILITGATSVGKSFLAQSLAKNSINYVFNLWSF